MHMGILATNKRANFDYTILENYEAGLELFGHEVKSKLARLFVAKIPICIV